MSFVHLHTHSEYSLLDGASRIADMIRVAVETGMPAMALTDHGVLYGAIDFYLQARAAGINPILGEEMYVATRSRHQKEGRVDRDPYHLILLVKDLTGYRNLIELSSRAHLEGYYYRPRIDKELLAQHRDGLIALSSCLGGEVANRLLEADPAGAEEAAREYQRLFGEDYFLEIQDHGMPEQARVNEGLAAISARTGIPLVATNDSHYTRRDDAEAHDILLCLQTGTIVSDPKRMRFHNDEFYLKGPQEMAERFAAFPEAVANTLRIAERCNLQFEIRPLLPRFEVPAGETAESCLRRLAEQGLGQRYPDRPGPVRERLEQELSVITEMGYAPYFLIVSDFIEYARAHGVAVGPGRGSAAGSIVSYALGITTLDPLRHGLIFERFLNRERISMPDIDIDFDDRNRDRVIDYVARRYGEDHVAQIITFGTMKARAVIRDVGRALDIPLREVDRLAKLVPPSLGMTIERALQMVPDLAAAAQDPAFAGLIRNARKLEGLARHASTHAAGIVIAPEPLQRFVPLQASITKGERNGEGKRAVMTQYEMNAVQKIGLLKMDFLGLRNLSIIQDTLRNLEARGLRLDLSQIPWDDPTTFRLLQAADTNGVFQLESAGLRRLLQDMRPTTFEDITAAIALFRPGPLEGGLVDQYIKCKHAEREIVYPLPELEPILKETYGVIVYQEQVMQIASQLGGFTLGEADVLRQAMGKKKKDEMARMRATFVSGALARGVSEAKATEIFDLMAFFAGYGFNKSHSAAYAVISYQTAYLKANYPLEYLAALLNNEAGNYEKVAAAVLDCHARGIEVLPPDINRSEAGFCVQDGRIRYGLAVIKNVGSRAVDLIVAERRRADPFRSLLDLCTRVDLRDLNKRVLESLIRSGALDALGERARLLASIDRVTDRANQVIQERESGQTSLFGMLPDADELDDPAAGLVEPMPAMPQEERLRAEKELLGLYLSDHPLRRIEQELHARVDTYANQITTEMEALEVRVGGVIKAVRPVVTRNGKAMAFVQLEDLTSTVEVIVFPRVYEDRRDLLQPDTVVIVRGKVDTRTAAAAEDDERAEAAKVLADDILAFDDPGHEMWARNQVVHIDLPAEAGLEKLPALEEVLARCPGPDRVVLHVQREDGTVDMEVGDRFRVQGGGPAGERAQREVDELFGRPVWRVEVIRKRAPERPANGRPKRAAAAPTPVA